MVHRTGERHEKGLGDSVDFGSAWFWSGSKAGPDACCRARMSYTCVNHVRTLWPEPTQYIASGLSADSPSAVLPSQSPGILRVHLLSSVPADAESPSPPARACSSTLPVATEYLHACMPDDFKQAHLQSPGMLLASSPDGLGPIPVSEATSVTKRQGEHAAEVLSRQTMSKQLQPTLAQQAADIESRGTALTQQQQKLNQRAAALAKQAAELEDKEAQIHVLHEAKSAELAMKEDNIFATEVFLVEELQAAAPAVQQSSNTLVALELPTSCAAVSGVAPAGEALRQRDADLAQHHVELLDLRANHAKKQALADSLKCQLDTSVLDLQSLKAAALQHKEHIDVLKSSLDSRQRKLADAEMQLKSREAELKSQGLVLDLYKQEANSMNKQNLAQLESLRVQQEQCASKEAALAAREAALAKDEEVARLHVSSLGDQQSLQAAREQDLQARASALASMEQELQHKLASVAEQEQTAAGRQAEAGGLQRQNAVQQEALRVQQEQCASKEAALAAREAALAKDEEVARLHVSSLGDQQSLQAARDQDLQARASALASMELHVQENERALVARMEAVADLVLLEHAVQERQDAVRKEESELKSVLSQLTIKFIVVPRYLQTKEDEVKQKEAALTLRETAAVLAKSDADQHLVEAGQALKKAQAQEQAQAQAKACQEAQKNALDELQLDLDCRHRALCAEEAAAVSRRKELEHEEARFQQQQVSLMEQSDLLCAWDAAVCSQEDRHKAQEARLNEQEEVLRRREEALEKQVAFCDEQDTLIEERQRSLDQKMAQMTEQMQDFTSAKDTMMQQQSTLHHDLQHMNRGASALQKVEFQVQAQLDDLHERELRADAWQSDLEGREADLKAKVDALEEQCADSELTLEKRAFQLEQDEDNIRAKNQPDVYLNQAVEDADGTVATKNEALVRWNVELSEWACELEREAKKQSQFQTALQSQLVKAKRISAGAASKKEAISRLEKEAASRLECLQSSIEQREQQLLHAESSGEFARQTVELRQHIGVTKALKEELEFKDETLRQCTQTIQNLTNQLQVRSRQLEQSQQLETRRQDELVRLEACVLQQIQSLGFSVDHEERIERIRLLSSEHNRREPQILSSHQNHSGPSASKVSNPALYFLMPSDL
eukprot:gene5792-1033_t